MKVAVCLSGDMRNCSECLDSLVDQVITPFKLVGAQVDVLIHTRLDPWCWNLSKLQPRIYRCECNVQRIDPSDIISKFNSLSNGESDHPDAKGTSEHYRRPFFYQAYLQYLRSLEGVAELKCRAENQDDELYDWVVRARPDIWYPNPLLISELQAGMIHFPAGDWWRCEGKECRSDKFAIGPSLEMNIYFSRREHLRIWCQQHELHSEGLMMDHLELYGVEWKVLDNFSIRRSDKMYKFSLRPDREVWEQ